ncbi:MAG: HK97 gp10 family phage protein [Clostridia bacterium]|nr:HK97 gp10 family phage protein [Clostridia bacterium]
MANGDGTFGFDDLQKAFNRIEQKYPNKTDAMLMAMARVAANRTKGKTPVGETKKLKSTWRTKKPKVYGKARVARMQSASRYAHLVEDGHEIVTGGKGSKNGRKLNVLQRAVRGVKSGGRTEGKKMIASAMSDIESTFDKSAEKLLADLVKEVEL